MASKYYEYNHSILGLLGWWNEHVDVALRGECLVIALLSTNQCKYEYYDKRYVCNSNICWHWQEICNEKDDELTKNRREIDRENVSGDAPEDSEMPEYSPIRDFE